MDRFVSLARKLGWKVFHDFDSRRNEPGFPDLVLVRDRVIFAELKTERGRVSKEQIAWIHAIKSAGTYAAIWRPSDWVNIQKILTYK